MAKKKEKNGQTTNTSDLSTKQLRSEIRRLTIDVNERIREYREMGGATKYFEKMVNRLKYISSYTVKKKIYGEVETVKQVPRGYKGGEIGLGTSTKLKSELQQQLSALRNFIEKDEYSPKGVEEFNAKVNRQYETFKERYGEISKEDYLEMIDTMNLVKHALEGWGYGDTNTNVHGVHLGASLAGKYVEATEEGRGKFLQYVEQAKKNSKGGSTEDLFDELAEIMKADGVIPEDIF